ncbi:TonB-dependent receptor [Pinibacter soli]|uniref:TonB-dependent receptor n=1 Tax=Pinibacter soli TaxID=3044211 RepID=A0ABT6RGI4_9BACT|nr:TonB-dependent receptor [Pinibacter soli]MDI3321684.1 TonB-dependent receptor [Pinibacter soli]
MTAKTLRHLFLTTALLLTFSYVTNAQLTQTIRGTVTDQLLQKSLDGVTVTITDLNRTTTTAADGSFRFANVPVGLHHVHVTHIGYKDATIENITLNSGKEYVVSISLDVDPKAQEEVIVKAKSKRNRPLNEMSLVSARAFTVEETQKYAAAVNDPLRMATSFPGVIGADDGRNDIVIRGNSPTGLLWKMEGMDIPNPNHFSNPASSGGGISILSAQLLSNSDFITGAFAADYGNALSGVFDIHLRQGNNEKREYTAQAGVLGLNLAAEGPFSKNYKGSYLVNYRYSTLSILDKVGVNVGDGTTNFQDLSYNIFLPTKKAGDFTIFGFGGLSNQDYNGEKDSSKWEDDYDRVRSTFTSNTGFAGIKHNIALSRSTRLTSGVGYSIVGAKYNENYAENPDSIVNTYDDKYTTKKLSVTTTLNHKINYQQTLRAGMIANFYNFNYYQRSRENPTEPVTQKINTADKTQTIQGFAEWQYKPVNNVTVDAGLHYLQLLYNDSKSIEPRAAIKWDVTKTNTIGLAYGRHSQMQALGVYFAETTDNTGKIYHPNKDLGFTKANHYVFSYSHLFSRNLRFKTEFYYQQLLNVPVSTSDTNTLSTLNLMGDYTTDPMVNNGKGKNYGVEISLEKYMCNYFYFLASGSLFQSKYTASDGIERNTRFNSNYAANFTGGKDFVSGNGRRTFGVNIKVIYTGGFRDTPIDVEKSKAYGYTYYIDKEAYSLQNPAYFRTDLRLSMKWNRTKHTNTLSLDLQNLTNRQNYYGQYFDPTKGTVQTAYQTGLIPILNYKVEW